VKSGNPWVGAVIACFCAATMAVHAQEPRPGSAPPGSTPPRSGPPGSGQPPGSKTGNPTPGTPQPDPPNLADRITLTGCVQASVSPGARGAKDPNNPSDSRFVLTKAERKNIVPPDTGTSTVAGDSTSPTYRLNAIDSQLSPFAGTTVEVSGEVLPSAPGGREAGGQAPTLQVEFVQKLSEACS
jgi:hypothetical protein